MNKPEREASEITQMLREWSGGKPEVLDNLLPLVYTELHRQAASFLRKERPGHTLQTTALINEAYLKLIDRRDVNWESRTHFFAVAAQAMRRILVDHARTKYREKRGGDNVKLSLEYATLVAAKEKGVDLIALDEALNKLAEFDAQQARVVELRYFSGLSLEETAEALHISRATVARDWEAARAWLHRELTK
ncbi:MAG: sigma-70 family RNA polymerase sigma factor [Acidobacteria bacterium]|nr:sigma-70 family RNA polymerase sigma factor [Acidobacteriota bacterium]MCA1639400.1 sigma-70 family RNA polymerase sigma factor [Acidobacteriota bacterium]